MNAKTKKKAAPRRDYKAHAVRKEAENQRLRVALGRVCGLIHQHFTGIYSLISDVPPSERESYLGVAHREASEALRTPQS